MVLYAIAALFVMGVVGTIAFKIYNSGKTTVIIEQERKLNELGKKTNDAKTDALTTPDVDDELRKYSRPD